MIILNKSLLAWGLPSFNDVFKQELAQLDIEKLPLQQGLSTGNYVSNTPITVAIHSIVEMDKVIRVNTGIFYQGIIGGCSCTDDPTPISDINEYCEVQFDIDKNTAQAVAVLLV